MFLFKREKNIIKKIEDYLTEIDACKNHFLECILRFVTQQRFDPQIEQVDLVHRSESLADDKRRAIEFELYKKTLVPESREDILFLLEALDSIPNCFQNVSYNLSCQKTLIPAAIKEDILLFVKKNLEAYEEVRGALNGFFFRRTIIEKIKKTDQLESETDKLERALISKIFDLEIETAFKLIFKDLVEKIARISDRAQDVADRLTIAVIKRRL